MGQPTASRPPGGNRRLEAAVRDCHCASARHGGMEGSAFFCHFFFFFFLNIYILESGLAGGKTEEEEEEEGGKSGGPWVCACGAGAAPALLCRRHPKTWAPLFIPAPPHPPVGQNSAVAHANHLASAIHPPSTTSVQPCAYCIGAAKLCLLMTLFLNRRLSLDSWSHDQLFLPHFSLLCFALY